MNFFYKLACLQFSLPNVSLTHMVVRVNGFTNKKKQQQKNTFIINYPLMLQTLSVQIYITQCLCCSNGIQNYMYAVLR